MLTISCSNFLNNSEMFVIFPQQVYLWGGLLLFCGFIVWDTQMIIEKKRRGDGDYIGHSVELFIDFIQVFRKIVIILTSKVILISGYSILINLIYWTHDA